MTPEEIVNDFVNSDSSFNPNRLLEQIKDVVKQAKLESFDSAIMACATVICFTEEQYNTRIECIRNINKLAKEELGE